MIQQNNLLQKHSVLNENITGIGISCGGPLSSKKGLIQSPPNLPGWDKKCLDYALKNNKNEDGLFVGKEGVQSLVEHGGMLEILARYAWIENKYNLSKPNSSLSSISKN